MTVLDVSSLKSGCFAVPGLRRTLRTVNVAVEGPLSEKCPERGSREVAGGGPRRGARRREEGRAAYRQEE